MDDFLTEPAWVISFFFLALGPPVLELDVANKVGLWPERVLLGPGGDNEPAGEGARRDDARTNLTTIHSQEPIR